MNMPSGLPTTIHSPLLNGPSVRASGARACRPSRLRATPIHEVAFEKFDVEVIEIAALAGDEIVSDADTVVPSHQLLREMGSDEPGAARHKVEHTVEAHSKNRSQRRMRPRSLNPAEATSELGHVSRITHGLSTVPAAVVSLSPLRIAR